MIGTAEDARLPCSSVDDGGSMMAAHIVEGAKLAIVSSNDYQRLARKFRGDEFSRLRKLISARDHLPAAGEDVPAFQFGDALVHYQRAGIVCACSSGS